MSQTSVAVEVLKKYEGMVIDQVVLATWPEEQIVVRVRPVGYAPSLHRWVAISAAYDGALWVDELRPGSRVLARLLAGDASPPTTGGDAT